jgi:hypothetical protein
MSAKTGTGRMGEFLASYILETYGIEVHHVDRAGADLWCKAHNKLFTVQVKAATVPIKSNDHTSVAYYNYATRNPNADYFCFVALDRQLLLLRKTVEVGASTVRIAHTEFNEANQRRTVEELLSAT